MMNLNVLRVFLCLIFVNLFFFANSVIPKTKLCANDACSQPISLGVTLLRYHSDVEAFNLPKNTPVEIYSKGLDPSEYWVVKAGKQLGYIPPTFVKENKVLLKKKQLVEVTQGAETPKGGETDEDPTQPSIPVVGNDSSTSFSATPEIQDVSAEDLTTVQPVPLLFKGVSADSTTDGEIVRPHEVFDGTTLYLTPEGDTVNEIVSSPTADLQQVTQSATVTTEKTHVAGSSEEEEGDMGEDEEEGDEEDEEEDEEEGEEEVDSEELVEGNRIDVPKDSSETLNSEERSGGSWSVLMQNSGLGTAMKTDGGASQEPGTVNSGEVVQDSAEVGKPEVEDIDTAKKVGVKEIAEEVDGGGDIGTGVPVPDDTLPVIETTEEPPLELNSELLFKDTEPPPVNIELGSQNIQQPLVNSEPAQDSKPLLNSEPTTQNSQPPLDIEPTTQNSEPLLNSEPTTQNSEPLLNSEPKATNSDPPLVNSDPTGSVPPPPLASSEPPLQNFEPLLNSEPKATNSEPPLVNSDLTASVPLPPLASSEPPLQNSEPLVVNPEPPLTNSGPVSSSEYSEPKGNTVLEGGVGAASEPQAPPRLDSEGTPPSDGDNKEGVIPSTAEAAEGTTENSVAFTEVNNGASEPVLPPSGEGDSAANEGEIPDNETSPTEELATPSEPGFFASILSMIGLSSSPDVAEVTNETHEDPLPSIPLQQEELQEKVEDLLGPDGTCKTVSGLESNCLDAPLPVETGPWQAWSSSEHSRPGTLQTGMYLLITAITVLVFTLGHYFIEKSRNDGPLIAKVNKLEQELLVATMESNMLKEEVLVMKNNPPTLMTSLAEPGLEREEVMALRADIAESKKQRLELEALVESLQQELDAATEAGLDLNMMLSDVLTQKHGSDAIMQSVEHLQRQLDSQQKVIEEMNQSLLVKSQENANLEGELRSANESTEALEQELNNLKENWDTQLKETEELASQNRELMSRVDTLTTSRRETTGQLERTQQEAEEVKTRLVLREGELAALKDYMKQMEGLGGAAHAEEVFSVGLVKAELAKVEREKEALQDSLREEVGARELLEEHVKSVSGEVSRLQVNYEEADREKLEAQTRLEVLSNYFKEKETQLQKELGLQEAMWVQKQGDDTTIYERMKSLQEEVDNYKSQNETLKKEIIDQERGLKGQIANLEKKAHENWVAARQAERKLEESKQEAGQLRNRLTLMEKNISNDTEPKVTNRLGEINGDPLSPLHADTSSPMMFPPLPPDPSLLPPGFMPPPFMPPPPPPPGGFLPPPPFLPGDRRPPPLGRMSSPPLNSRFSPPPPDYMYDRMSPPSLSPPVRGYQERDRFRHRTPPSPSYPSNSSRQWEEDLGPHSHTGFRPVSSQRDPRRDHKGSALSSGHSSSDSLDKSSRHSGKV